MVSFVAPAYQGVGGETLGCQVKTRTSTSLRKLLHHFTIFRGAQSACRGLVSRALCGPHRRPQAGPKADDWLPPPSGATTVGDLHLADGGCIRVAVSAVAVVALGVGA